MANVRKTITASLGSLNDKDLFDFLEQMESKGVTVSKLVKDALRYYQANYISNKKKQKNDIDYNRIESIVEKTVKKVLEEMDIASSLASNILEQTDTIETVNPQVKSPKQGAKLPKGKRIKGIKEAVGLEEQEPIQIETVKSVEESPLTTIEAVEETEILEEGLQVEQEVEKTESQIDGEVSIEVSAEVITTEEEIIEEEIIEDEQKEEMIEEVKEEVKEESLAEKKEIDNSDLEALVSGMITIR